MAHEHVIKPAIPSGMFQRHDIARGFDDAQQTLISFLVDAQLAFEQLGKITTAATTNHFVQTNKQRVGKVMGPFAVAL
jgi:hypothetical protein